MYSNKRHLKYLLESIKESNSGLYIQLKTLIDQGNIQTAIYLLQNYPKNNQLDLIMDKNVTLKTELLNTLKFFLV